MNWFGTKYKDDEIVMHAEQAIVNDPVLNPMSRIGVTSEDGVVSIVGKVNSERERRHTEDLARQALDGNGLKYQEIVNKIEVS